MKNLLSLSLSSAIQDMEERKRKAVRGPDSYGYPGEGRHEGIVAFQFLPCHPRTDYDGYPAAVHLVALGDRVGKDGIPFGGEGLHAFAEVVSEERVKHDFLKNVREVSVFRAKWQSLLRERQKKKFAL